MTIRKVVNLEATECKKGEYHKPNCDCQPQPAKGWEKRFEEEFGWLFKGSIKITGVLGKEHYLNVEMTRGELLGFIRTELSLARADEQRWMKYAEDEIRAYERGSTIDEVVRVVKGMEKEVFDVEAAQKSPTHATASAQNYGYNQALTDIITKLKNYGHTI